VVNRGLEKARIALAIANSKGGGHEAKIIVGKNWLQIPILEG